ncbi:hypothetical protein PMZ80_011169 [Knufia obscura]|uniref:Uncharacterized protein n=2 Tax=Knufia TaxID=430999 RepID=A0AAN8ELV6_9EURO|nr:hypothetical protein PMZ80_011169 [Knufia obscura]KAK5947833.1 hypothetical protein OHC33_011149 [Knufia fluminis]
MLSPPSAHKLSEKFAVNIVGHDVASSRVPTPNIPPPPPVRYHTCTSLDLDDYFLTLAARNLARLIWLHVVERDDPEHPEYAKRYLLSKISAIQLINAFCIALKRRLRFGPAVDYPDLRNLVVHLEGTMASRADQDALKQQNPSAMKRFGNNLGVTIAASNPRKLIKRSTDNLGNLPHEMLSHLTAYLESIIQGQDAMPTLCCQNLAFTDVRIMADILTGCERILNTPLPLAYSISISQITWVYIMVLPFQLVVKLGWTTIPATMVAAYIILGLAMISQEVENPFGNDVSDLPMDAYCTEIGADLDVLTSVPMVEYKKFTCSPENRPLYPLSHGTVTEWEQRTIEEIRTALRAKTGNVSNNISIDKFE